MCPPDIFCQNKGLCSTPPHAGLIPVKATAKNLLTFLVFYLFTMTPVYTRIKQPLWWTGLSTQIKYPPTSTGSFPGPPWRSLKFFERPRTGGSFFWIWNYYFFNYLDGEVLWFWMVSNR
jgi:hypothetical protein